MGLLEEIQDDSMTAWTAHLPGLGRMHVGILDVSPRERPAITGGRESSLRQVM